MSVVKEVAAKGTKSGKLPLIIGVCAATAIIAVAAAVAVMLAKKPPVIPVLSANATAVMTAPLKVITAAEVENDFTGEFYYPLGIALLKDGQSGEFIVADSMADRIQIISVGDLANVSETVKSVERIGAPGSNEFSYAESGEHIDGEIGDARFKKPSDVAVLGDGIIVCDTENNAVRRIADKKVRTVAGAAGEGYQNGKGDGVKFNKPRGIAVYGDDIYVADTMNHCIRKIDKDGEVTLFAGTPECSGYADGKLTEAMFFEPSGLTFADGALYIADSANHAIRKIENGEVTTVAGRPGDINPSTEYPDGGLADGDNASALFNFPTGLTVLENGDIYVADAMNHCIRLITQGETRTVIGGGEAGKFYESSENLKLSKPSGIASDGETLYITDALNNTVVAVPITESLNEGRSLRESALARTEVPQSAYSGEPRVFVDGTRVDMKKVKPWNTADGVYLPVEPLFKALGADVDVKKDGVVITVDGLQTELAREGSYFVRKGEAVMPEREFIRLFPYTFEWFPEFGVIAIETD